MPVIIGFVYDLCVFAMLVEFCDYCGFVVMIYLLVLWLIVLHCRVYRCCLLGYLCLIALRWVFVVCLFVGVDLIASCCYCVFRVVWVFGFRFGFAFMC